MVTSSVETDLKTHSSKPPGLLSKRPALKAFIFYSLGIASGVYIKIFPLVAIFIAVLLAIAALIFHYRQIVQRVTWLLYLSLFVCGIAQYQIATSGFPPTHVKKIADTNSHVTVVGEIVEEPDIRPDRTYLVVEVDSLTWRKRVLKSSGRILVKIKEPSVLFSFRDRVRLSGYLFSPGGPRNPGGFDFARYLNIKEIFGMIVLPRGEDIWLIDKPGGSWWTDKLGSPYKFFINRLVAPLRQILLDGYDKYLPKKHASLLAGFVLGERRDIPDDIARLFRDTGTLHLMAVSGSNVAIIVGFFWFILAQVNRRLKIIIILVAVVFFSFLTRNEPSVVRASVMASVGLLGFYRQRRADFFGLLGFAGLLLLILNPLWLFNVSFQLSYAACTGIVYFVPKFTSVVKPGKGLVSKIFYWIFMIFITTFAAQLAVLPLTAEYFHRLPLVGLVANLPMVPLASILTISGVIFLPFILLGDIAASIFAWPVEVVMSVIIPLLDFFAGLPMAVINVSPPGIWKIILFFAAVYALTEFVYHKRLSTSSILACISALCILVWMAYLKGPKTESLAFIDCGPDRAVLFCDSDGKNFLWYDCHEEDVCRQLEFNLIPFLYRMGINQIDTVFTNDKVKLSHLADEIHIGNFLASSDLKAIEPSKIMATNPYILAESILNKRVKFVKLKSDNNSKPLTDGLFFKLRTAGGECILAGALSARYVDVALSKALIVELPWTVQPYGPVFERLKAFPPDLLVFSPDKRRFPSVRDRQQLTYMSERTWATSMSGSFRFRFEEGKISIDYMVKN